MTLLISDYGGRQKEEIGFDSELPNGGRVRSRARISWPLGFTGGMNSKLTGRENVKFVPRLYGHDPRKIISFVEDFGELGADMDVAIKTYSSGMIARLVFGLSPFDRVRPLSHRRGDGGRRRAFGRALSRGIRQTPQDSDIIMVSHAMMTIQEYCNQGIVLSGGQMHVFRNVDDAIDLHKNFNA